jgi:hypothetical protein
VKLLWGHKVEGQGTCCEDREQKVLVGTELGLELADKGI